MNSITPNSHVNKLQASATNPKASIWVSANAGSGKTYVLSRRVIRLLLEGNKPSELLCLTFTKAAAAEMSNRVFKILSEWAMMEDGALLRAIEELLDKPLAGSLKQKLLSRARVLFALALDTPGGLRIQTIHAFCESLLHQFPLEANVPGHFEMMDDMTQSQVLEEARRFVVLGGLGLRPAGASDHGSTTHTKIFDAFETIRNHASDNAIEKAINQLIHEREAFGNWIGQSGGDVQLAMAPLWQRFGLSPEISEADLIEKFAIESAYSKNDLNELIELAKKKTSPSYQDLASSLEAMSQSTDPKILFELRQSIFLTQKQEPRKALVHKSFLENDTKQTELFQKEQMILLEQIDLLKTLESLKASEALFVIAQAILIEYDNLKKRRGALDFNDLIARTAGLLSREEISAWIHYKLDSGISHLLVDEAQDTSPLQWKIIESITAEFYAGKGAREQVRTVFVVGDEKQSIYSFQGADPMEFAKQFSLLKNKTENAKLEFDRVQLTTSFRSTPEVLSAVDQVFSLPENAAGLGLENKHLVHQANRLSDRGEVFVWPLEIKYKNPEKSHWRIPPDEATQADAEVRLAEKIADTIDDWIKTGQRLPGRGAPIRYGDILILVRKRDRFVSAINRALKTRGLAAAGADRLKLTDHIAIEDMLALGRVACMKMDDLSLACILKSPIFDFSEDELFAVANDRTEPTLFDQLVMLNDDPSRLSDIGPSREKLRHCVDLLHEIHKTAHSRTVHGFYGHLFSRHQLRQKYLNRLGYEVIEILDGFFQAAINYDNQVGLGLQGFVEGLSGSKPELKREIDMERNEIRVITTHSAKGLEAPIVFLVDPGSKAFDTSHAPGIIQIEDGNGKPTYLWQSSTKARISASAPVFEAIEKAAEEEYRRLLYVGMTRAADRLIVCGYRPEDEPKYSHWHKMVEHGLSAEPIEKSLNGKYVEPDSGEPGKEQKQWVIENKAYKKVEPKTKTTAPVKPASETPQWCSLLPIEPPAPRPLSPSGVLQLLDIAPESETVFQSGNSLAVERGNAVHDLMQILPDMPSEKHEGAISNYFGLSNANFDSVIISEIRHQISRLLDAPESHLVFGVNSRAEVEITGEVQLGERSHLVRGKIDRLAFHEDRIIIADYKTNRQVPDLPENTSPEYLAQMAFYRQLVSQIYPEKTVECIIIWTETGYFMPLPQSLLDKQMNLLNKS